MAPLDRPRLRPLQPVRVAHAGRPFVGFRDAQGAADSSVLVPLELYQGVVRHFDGRRTLGEVRTRALQESGQRIAARPLEALVRQLDAAMILDGPTFAAFRAEYRAQRTRPAALAGCAYAGTDRALRAQLAHFFAHHRGAGWPHPDGAAGAAGQPPAGPRLRGILSPHIDFRRGGPIYTWSYKHVLERSDAEVFVILGVAHQPCEHRFALTRKDFQTPLGLARTDRSYVDRLAALAGDHLFDDELAHRTEHSVEFQVVFLQYILGHRDFAIVPILVGSFHDLMLRGTDPIADPEVRRFVAALRAAERASGKAVAYIGGIDLGHVGPEFGDPQRLDEATLEQLRAFDSGMLAHAAAGDPAAWFARAAGVQNRWRVCGLAATYTMLHAMGSTRGTLLQYDQAVNPERTCCVSFCSVAFDHPDGPASRAEPAVPA